MDKFSSDQRGVITYEKPSPLVLANLPTLKGRSIDLSQTPQSPMRRAHFSLTAKLARKKTGQMAPGRRKAAV